MIAALCHYSSYHSFYQLPESEFRQPQYICSITAITNMAFESLYLCMRRVKSRSLKFKLIAKCELFGYYQSVNIKQIAIWQQRNQLPNQTTKPIILLLVSDEMPYPVYRLSTLRQLEMSHTVIWKRVRTAGDAMCTIEAVAKRGSIHHLIWDAPGNHKGITLSQQYGVNANSTLLIQTIKRSLHSHATISFWSCQAAKEASNREDHFARLFARATGRRVIGAKTKMFKHGVHVKQGDVLEFKIYHDPKLSHRFKWIGYLSRYLPFPLFRRLARDVTYDSDCDPLVRNRLIEAKYGN